MQRADYGALFEMALERIASMPSGTVFLAKEPFNGLVWKALERGEKLEYGRYFKNKVLLGEVPNVIFIGKQDNNSALYKKL